MFKIGLMGKVSSNEASDLPAKLTSETSYLNFAFAWMKCGWGTANAGGWWMAEAEWDNAATVEAQLDPKREKGCMKKSWSFATTHMPYTYL